MRAALILLGFFLCASVERIGFRKFRFVFRLGVFLVFILLAILCAGCDAPEPPSRYDQCMRAELFKTCLAAVPVGPVSVNHNDWGKVVDECETAAARQSLRNPRYIKPECKT